MTQKPVQLLLVEDDEDDYLLTVDLIEEIRDAEHVVTWPVRLKTALTS